MRTEGEDNGEWIIVDCGAAVVHVMQPAIRTYYHLEEIWGDKPVRMKLDDTPAKLVKASGDGKSGTSLRSAGASRVVPSKKAGAKPAPRKAAATKAPAKRTPARKTAAKKTPAKNAASRGAVTRSTGVKRTAAKAASGKAPAKTSTARR
jgi:ribosome-associated protein